MNVQHVSGADSTVGAGATQYYGVYTGTHQNSSVEARVFTEAQTAGTFSNIFCYVSANAVSGGTSVLRFRKNTANGNQNVTIGNGVTGQFEDTSNTDSVTTDDDLALSITAGTGGALTVRITNALFAPGSGTVTGLMRGGASWGSGATDMPCGITAHNNGNDVTAAPTEADCQATFNIAGTLQALWMNIDANTRTDTVVWRSRINGVNGNIAVSVSAGATGVQEDTSNTDSVASGDEINLLMDVGAGTGTMRPRSMRIDFVSGSDAFPFSIMQEHGLAGPACTNGAQRYVPVAGAYRGAAVEATEVHSQSQANVAFTWRDMVTYVSLYSLGGTHDLTLRSRVNGANGNMVVVHTGTGQLSDTSNTDSVAIDDEFNYSFLATSSGGGSATVGPVSSIAQAVQANVTISPPAGALSITRAAVALAFALGMPVGTLTITGQAPTPSIAGNAISIPAGSLQVVGRTPALASSVGMPVQAVTIQGYAPAVTSSTGMPAGSVVITGQVPTVIVSGSIAIPAGALTITGQAPGIAFSGPDAGVLTIQGYAPALAFNVAMPVGSLVITGRVPSPQIAAQNAIPVPAGTLAITGLAPASFLEFYAAHPAGALTITGQAPTLATSSNQIPSPLAGALAIRGYAPSLFSIPVTPVEFFIVPAVDRWFVVEP